MLSIFSLLMLKTMETLSTSITVSFPMKSSLYVKNKSILSLLEEQHADKQNAYAHTAAEKIFPQSGESAVHYKPSEHLNIMIKRIETDYVLHHFGHRLKGVEYRRKVQPHCEQNAVKVLDIPENTFIAERTSPSPVENTNTYTIGSQKSSIVHRRGR